MTFPSPLHEKEQASEAFFDGWSAGYEDRRISPWFRYTQGLALDALDLAPDSRILDIGCGTGYAVRTVAMRIPEGRACGLDISHAMVEQARSRVPHELADRVEIVQGSSSQIPWDAAAFTHVICTNSFHHYPDPLGVLGEITRVLVPGGQVVIFENAPDLSLYTRMWDLALRFFETGHVRYYTMDELADLLERAGLEERRLLAHRNEFRKYGKLFASIQLWSARTPSSKAI